MKKKEYCLKDGYLHISDEGGCLGFVYNHDKSKCVCLSTGYEFDFEGKDKPASIGKGEHDNLISVMRSRYEVEGKISLVSFEELFSVYPELKREEYMKKAFSKEGLMKVRPVVLSAFRVYALGKTLESQIAEEEIN